MNIFINIWNLQHQQDENKIKVPKVLYKTTMKDLGGVHFIFISTSWYIYIYITYLYLCLWLSVYLSLLSLLRTSKDNAEMCWKPLKVINKMVSPKVLESNPPSNLERVQFILTFVWLGFPEAKLQRSRGRWKWPVRCGQWTEKPSKGTGTCSCLEVAPPQPIELAWLAWWCARMLPGLPKLHTQKIRKQWLWPKHGPRDLNFTEWSKCSKAQSWPKKSDHKIHKTIPVKAPYSWKSNWQEVWLYPMVPPEGSKYGGDVENSWSTQT